MGLRGWKGEGKRFVYDMFASQQDQGQVPKRDGEAGKDVADNVADSKASSRAPLHAESPAPAHPT